MDKKIIKKLFILILLLLPRLSQAQIMVDNCEYWTGTSISPWTQRTLSGTGTISSTTERAYSGSYGIKCDDNINTGNVWDMLSKTITADNTFYFRFYVYFPLTTFSTFTTTNDYQGIFMIAATTATVGGNCFPVVLSIGTDSAMQNMMRLQITNNHQQYLSQSTIMNYNGIINEEQWYCIEIGVPSSSGTLVQWWVDGVEQSSGTLSNFKDTTAWSVAYYGWGYYCQPYAPAYQHIFYMDSFYIQRGNFRIEQEKAIIRRFPKTTGY